MSLFLLLLITAGAVQFPYVQTKLVNYINKELSEKLGYGISVNYLSIWWFDNIEIEDVVIIDPEFNKMIYAKSIDIDFDLSSLLNKTDHHLDDIVIKDASVDLTKIFVDNDSLVTLNINDFIRKVKRVTQGGTPKRMYLSCDDIKLSNATFKYNDQLHDSLRNKFDYFHFTIDSIYGSFENIYTVRDTFGLDVTALRGVDRKTGLALKRMKSKFAVSQSAMLFDDLELHAGSSVIKDSIRFDYKSTTDLSDFNNKILINAHFNNSELHTKDLAHFAPQLRKYHEKYILSGKFNGRVKSFLLSDASISFGIGSTIKGKIRMTGLPSIDETFIDFDLTNSYLTVSDLSQYLSQKTYSRLKPVEHISFNAEFLGYPNDFVALGNFYTQHGRIESDINLKLSNDISETSYSGRISTQNFDLGGYLNDELFGALSMSGNIQGSGFTIETADFKLEGQIDNIGIKNYEYHNIITNARFAKEFFEGNLSIDDPNLKLALNGSIDLRGGLNFFNITANIDTTNLKVLNITKDDLIVRSDAYVNARGLKIDDILGAANLGNTYIKYRNNAIQIDSMSIISDKDEEKRIVLLNTNLLNANITGEFDLTELYYSMKELIIEYQLSLKNDSKELEDYYKNKKHTIEDYFVNYNINIKDLNPLLKVFAPDIYVSSASKISGNITGGYTSIISLDTKLDSLSIKDNLFLDNDIQLNISKISDSTNVLAMLYVASKNQEISKISTKKLLFEGIWDNNHIDYEFDITQENYDNNAQLLGTVDFLKDSIEFRLESADLKILDEQWNIKEDNYISIAGKNVYVNNFKIFSGNQSFSIEGKFSEDPDELMEIEIDSINLDNLNTVINKNLNGIINGYARISNIYTEPLIINDLTVNNFEVDDFLIGDITSSSVWNNLKRESDINCHLTRLGYNILDLTGTYAPYNSSPLKLKAILNGTELKIVEPFLSNYFTQINGKLNGEIYITGSPTNPDFNGTGRINDAQLHVNYLNTDYSFEGGFYLTHNQIGFRNISLTDIDGQNGQLNGYIAHDNFKKMSISMNADFQDFQVLNTTSNDNSLFYGNGEATGTISFYGYLNNMNITANARTDKGTRIFIPIGDSESIEQEEYINFVDFGNDVTSLVEEQIESIDLRGIKLDFDLDITNDAYCEIIFDIKSGDIIRGRGNGDIKLEIDTKGEFNMFGDFNIEEGGYNFTLYNLINKEFEILPYSKISWYGDPYQGILDINATYNQLASFLPLLPPQSGGDGTSENKDVVELRRKYPVDVLLEIDGALLSPTVDFDISAKNLPRNIQKPNGEVVDLEFEFLKFKNSIDEQELKRQVFSLIVLRRFSELQSFSAEGSVTSSVSELLSNQLSYWITQVDENLEIDIDFGKLDTEAFNTFQLRLSYTFFDGRLRVTRDGGFTNQSNKADVSSIAGDWTVEYLLTDDGKFKVKMYNRTNYNPINPTEENQNTITTGFSLIHTQSFDEIKDLFRRSREKALEKEEQEDENQEQEEEKNDSQVNAEATLPREEYND